MKSLFSRSKKIDSTEVAILVQQRLFLVPALPDIEWENINGSIRKLYMEKFLPAFQPLEAALDAASGSRWSAERKALADIKRFTAPEEHVKEALMYALLTQLAPQLPAVEALVRAGSAGAAAKALNPLVALLTTAHEQSDKLRCLITPLGTLLACCSFTLLDHLERASTEAPIHGIDPTHLEAALVLASHMAANGAKSSAKLISRLMADSPTAVPSAVATALAMGHNAPDDEEAFGALLENTVALLPLLIERFVQEASEAFSMIQNKGLGGDPRFYGGWLQDGITLLVGLATTVKEAANLCAAHTECSHAVRALIKVATEASHKVLPLLALFCPTSAADQYPGMGELGPGQPGYPLANPQLALALDTKIAVQDTKTAVESMRQDFAEYMRRELNINRQIMVLLYDKESVDKLSPDVVAAMDQARAQRIGGSTTGTTTTSAASGSSTPGLDTPPGGSSSRELPAGCNPGSYFPDTSELEQDEKTTRALEKMMKAAATQQMGKLCLGA